MKLIFTGDLCISGAIRPTLSDAVASLLNSADLVCVNVEAPFIDMGARPAPKAGPSIFQTDFALDLIKDCHATHVNLANNHIMDFGVAGLETTIRRLDGISILGAGLSYRSAYQASFFVHEGQRVGLLAFGEAQFGVLQSEILDQQAGFAWIDSPDARMAVLRAREQADWVIVQAHAGLEMVDIPLPEWRQRYREFIDLGADIVVGHHPHVCQGSECYKGRMIHYSLGNFYMDVMLQQLDPGSGSLLEVAIEKGQLSSRLIPLRVTRERIDLDASDESYSIYQLRCTKLTDERTYIQEIDDICESYWIDIYSKYYESALTGVGTKPRKLSIFRVISRLLSLLFLQRWDERRHELMLIHNIRIETHRWVVARALSKRSQ